jgi:hypothetical protein
MALVLAYIISITIYTVENSLWFRQVLQNILIKFITPMKLVRLIKMRLYYYYYIRAIAYYEPWF